MLWNAITAVYPTQLEHAKSQQLLWQDISQEADFDFSMNNHSCSIRTNSASTKY